MVHSFDYGFSPSKLIFEKFIWCWKLFKNFCFLSTKVFCDVNQTSDFDNLVSKTLISLPTKFYNATKFSALEDFISAFSEQSAKTIVQNSIPK